MSVGTRFSAFVSNLTLTDIQRSDGVAKHTGVRSCLNQHYHGVSSGYANSMLVGSWGKSTEIRPPRDIDILFELPKSVYDRFEQRPWGANKQSALLQEVKAVLVRNYSRTEMRADGQVIVVPFVSYAVELAPSFKLISGQYWICDTNGGGRYKTIDPVAEQTHMTTSSNSTNGNTRSLIRMMKCWQLNCNVPMKSFWIELLAVEFLSSWQYATNSTVYYDWMVRDFLRYLIARARWTIYVPGTGEPVNIGDEWLSRAETASARASKACEYEAAQKDFDAGYEWQKLFGTQIPLTT